MYPEAFIEYLIHFHCERDYFECHEVLEEHWKEDPVPERKKYWVGLIQIAVSFYHYRRGNRPGALKMMKSALKICQEQKSEFVMLGFQADELIKLLQKKYYDIENGIPYESINLPLTDKHLLAICRSQATKSEKSWGKASDFSNEAIIHKHKLRDRSETIAERQKQLFLKQKRRNE
ncbi:DUF309 domain-containing protein [Bacillus timonensis]|uniref:DUF309 domain-containing protein n=1 Tax=Bacillus timonensis TaxID=1033734 RepID=A0A4S3PYW0_9BACI|nr:DUF309 domain-containing protein [Bacillus timonensis]THE15028.1 DUF309 domain-containing protein [Bacillus timonensis]